MLGFPIIAIATESLRLFPPERAPESLFSCSVRFSYFIF
jgi:hypothetical protein